MVEVNPRSLSFIRTVPAGWVAILAIFGAACGDTDDTSNEGPSPQDAGVEVDLPDVWQPPDAWQPPDIWLPDISIPDSPIDTNPPDTNLPDVTEGGGDGGYPVPTPADIQFVALNPVPQGEQILFNDWAIPDSVSSMSVDGSTTVEIFRGYRVWSMGVSRATDRLAFACGDPLQEQHYGVTIGDAIQHTWMYDFATQSVEVIAYGNINDECHRFGPGDTYLYICRRYDFGPPPENVNKTYRIGRIDLATNQFEFLVSEDQTRMTLSPEPTPDESELYFSLIDVSSPPTAHYSIQKMPLPSGPPSLIRDVARDTAISPDGLRYLYKDYADGRKLYVSNLDGSNAIKVADRETTEACWSPDSTRIAFLADDRIQVVAADGSEANTPTTLRDSTLTGEFITELAWINRP